MTARRGGDAFVVHFVDPDSHVPLRRHGSVIAACGADATKGRDGWTMQKRVTTCAACREATAARTPQGGSDD